MEITRLPLRKFCIDDDPLFCNRFKRAAAEENIEVTSVKTMDEVGRLHNPLPYDVAVVDYHLGSSTASEVVPMLHGEIPVVVISEEKNATASESELTKAIFSFVPKAFGFKAMIDEALRAVGEGIKFPKRRVSTQIQALDLAYFAFVCLMLLLATVVISRQGTTEPRITNTGQRSIERAIPGFQFAPPKEVPLPPVKWDAAPTPKFLEHS